MIGKFEVEWLDYKHRVLPTDCSDIQLRETRKAFYGGGWSAFCLIEKILEGMYVSGDFEPLQKMRKEFDDFLELVKQGRA